MTDNRADERQFLILVQDAGYLQVEWKEGLSVTRQDATELFDCLEELSPSVCPPLLVRLNNMISLSRFALSAFASELNVSALALLGPTAVDRTISTFFMEVHEPPYPTRYFEYTVDAERWLLNPGRLDRVDKADATVAHVRSVRPPENTAVSEAWAGLGSHPGF